MSGNREHFFIKNGKMLFWRLGGMNSRKQLHWRVPNTHQPPTKRGIWCFPYPHYDYFFVYETQINSELPKHLKNKEHPSTLSDEDAKNWWDEREKKVKEVLKNKKPATFWYSGEFYSHISLHGISDYSKWFLWDSVKDWSVIARKSLITFEKWGTELYKTNYTKDHLEIFIPNY